MGRTGEFIPSDGVKAFVPKPLPHDPPVDLARLQRLLSEADNALGRIDAVTRFIPNPDLFVFMYVRKEAVLSSQIEGTQASLSDLLQYESGIESDRDQDTSDVDEVVNYIDAMNWGLAELGRLPLSLRLLRGVHERLLAGTRGASKDPGNYRKIQNWIGPDPRDIGTATFVPPPPQRLPDLLSELESYFHASDQVPPIVRAGLCHVQFETIHPFLDGNGRLGRLLITLMLCEQRVLAQPLLYLSAHFRQHQQTYYELLNRVRTHGDWESWLSFFLKGVRDVANGAADTAARVLDFQRESSERVRVQMPTNATARALLDLLYRHPVTTITDMSRHLNVTYSTAGSVISEFVRLRLLVEITGRQRDRIFRFQPYLDHLTAG